MYAQFIQYIMMCSLIYVDLVQQPSDLEEVGDGAYEGMCK